MIGRRRASDRHAAQDVLLLVNAKRKGSSCLIIPPKCGTAGDTGLMQSHCLLFEFGLRVFLAFGRFRERHVGGRWFKDGGISSKTIDSILFFSFNFIPFFSRVGSTDLR